MSRSDDGTPSLSLKSARWHHAWIDSVGRPGFWAYFSFGHKYPLKAEAAKNAAASCNECHQINAAKDYVFSQYYPVLRASAPRLK
jgi:cytochrome c553